MNGPGLLIGHSQVDSHCRKKCNHSSNVQVMGPENRTFNQVLVMWACLFYVFDEGDMQYAAVQFTIVIDMKLKNG